MITLRSTSHEHFELLLGETFDFESHKEFKRLVDEALDAGARAIAVNFAAVAYIDSSALGMLRLALAKAQKQGCTMELTGVKDGHARNVLQLVRFDHFFNISE